MGQAKSRKAELEALKPGSDDPEQTAEMARRLHTMFEVAKQNGNIDPPVNFLYSKLETTIQGFDGPKHLRPWPKRGTPEFEQLQAEKIELENRARAVIHSICRGC
jgi:hypothetical protein